MATTATTASTTGTTITNEGRKPLVKDLHEHIVCPLCRGYLIDATTLVECLHSFCRGCIVRRLGSGARACPVCGALTLPPLLPDLALQRLVYLAVPGLYRSELDRRRHFRLVNPQCQPPSPPLGALSLTLDDAVSLSLCEITNDDIEYHQYNHQDEEQSSAVPVTSSKKKKKNHHHHHHHNHNHHHHHHHNHNNNHQGDNENESSSSRRVIRYLKCPAGVTVRHLVRLLALKRGWGDNDGKFTLKNIEMLYKNNVNNDDDRINDDDEDDNCAGCKEENKMHRLQLSWTLLDLACIFKWDKETPMKLFYRVVKREEPIILQPPSISTYNNVVNSMVTSGNSNVMENVQRPPTPPPSPKQQSNPAEIRNQPQLPSNPIPKSGPAISVVDITAEGEKIEKPEPVEMEKSSSSASSTSSSSTSSSSASSMQPVNQPRVNPAETVTANTEAVQNPAVINSAESHGVKVKKPRCEVTPVMRAPGFNGSSSCCSPAVIATSAVQQIGGSGSAQVIVSESNNSRSNKVPRLDHHKRRKRRNKRLIAEITTTPREDLLKLKVRLTPCPPRITSNTAAAGGTAKEKLLQMRAVRREKIKTNNERSQTPDPPAVIPSSLPPVVTSVNNSPEMPLTPPPSASADCSNVVCTIMPVVVPVNAVKTNDDECSVVGVKKTGNSCKDAAKAEVQEETIEEIIDGIPDEVVRVAQNMINCPSVSSGAPVVVEESCSGNKLPPQVQQQESKNKKVEDDRFVVEIGKKKKKDKKRVPDVEIISYDDEEELEFDDDEEDDDELELDDEEEEREDNKAVQIIKPKKDEEVLRRLGLVAISEASKTLQDKIRGSKKSSSGGSGAGIDFNRESLERQLRESKANRVRSLLAEKQMRDALKSIMSKSKGGKGASGNGPKKGPPPLAPLTPKQGFSHPPKSSHPVNHHQKIQIVAAATAAGKIEKPLDLSSGANNALDLSPATPSSSVNVSSPPVITSTTFSSPVKSRTKSSAVVTGLQSQLQMPGKSSHVEEKKNQDLNLRTLSDAAVSLLGTNSHGTATAAAAAAAVTTNAGSEVRITNSTILSNKVALRIPQPHNRISGFGNGMKIKPNLAVRHIPNPQAFVASQYVRNQRTSFFNVQQQQPP